MFSEYEHEEVKEDYFHAVECMEAACRAGVNPCDREHSSPDNLCPGCPYGKTE